MCGEHWQLQYFYMLSSANHEVFGPSSAKHLINCPLVFNVPTLEGTISFPATIAIPLFIWTKT